MQSYYHYKKSRPKKGQRHVLNVLKAEETETEWIARLKGYGCTTAQIKSFQAVTSLEAFVKFCIDNGLEEACIPGKRLKTNAA